MTNHSGNLEDCGSSMFLKKCPKTPQSEPGAPVNDLIRIATVELARFLADQLPILSEDWWQKHVLERQSFQQQRIAQEAEA